MSLALKMRNCWECSGDKLSAMNQKGVNFVAQVDQCSGGVQGSSSYANGEVVFLSHEM